MSGVALKNSGLQFLKLSFVFLWLLANVVVFKPLHVFADEGFALSQIADGYDEEKWGKTCDSTMKYLTEGGFSALLTAIAGVGAIVAFAAGGFRAAWALLIVSMGSFILRSYLDAFFQGGCQ